MEQLVVQGDPIVVAVDRPVHRARVLRGLVVVSRVCAVVSVAVGAVVLAGYAFGWPAAVQLHGSLPPMYPNTAIGFVICGVAALTASHWRRRRRAVSAALFAIAFVAAAFTLLLHVLDAGPTSMEFLWPDDPPIAATTNVPGRPVAETCVAFMSVAAAGWLLAVRRAPRLSQALALGALSVGGAAVLGYLIGVNRRGLGMSFVAVGMALHTAIGLMLAGAAVMLAQPTVGLFGRLTHEGATGTVGRRLVFVVVVAPITLTALSAALQRAVPDAGLALSIATILQVLALALLVLLPLSAVDEIERNVADRLATARETVELAGERELLAARISSTLTVVPAAPKGWELGFRQLAAHASLPGDSCLVLCGGERFLVALVDVAGHDTEAAWGALRLRTEIEALWSVGRPLVEIAARLDRAVTEIDTIASGVLIDVDRLSGSCQYVNAGHPDVVLASAAGLRNLVRTQPLFGYAPQPGVAQSYLRRDDLLLLITDGVTEARDSNRKLLGFGPIEHALRLHGVTNPQLIADLAIDAALAHTAGRLRDDAVVLVLRRQ